MSGYAVGTMQRPLLFLDVDGPLIPFGGSAREYPVSREVESSNPLLARVNPALGSGLLALGCDLVWATTWMDEANECVAPLLGLPTLPVVTWPDFPEDDHDARIGLHWKTRGIVARAAGLPFVWIDDEATDVDRTWVANYSADVRGRGWHAEACGVGLVGGDGRATPR